MAAVEQLGVQEVYVVEEHFHCDGPEQEKADRQVGGHYHWAVELEQGPHGLTLALTVPVVFSFEDSGVPPDVVLLEAVVSQLLHSGMVNPFYLFL